jgi:hypothetical protein
MSSAKRSWVRRGKPKAAPRPLGVDIRRALRRVCRRVQRLARVPRSVRTRRNGLDAPPHWSHARMSVLFGRFATALGAVLLILLVLRTLSIIFGVGLASFPFGFNPDRSCKSTSYSCGVANSLAITLLTLAFVGAVFHFHRLRRVRKPYVERAREEPRELLQTAGPIIGEVVGRNQVCHVIMSDLHDRRGRRPHVVVGGVGTGKTAVLLKLTTLLAQNGAVPVPIRLRDAHGELDFLGLAKDRFIAEAARTSFSDLEGEKAWRQLCKDDQVVVIADGLDETFTDANGNGAGHERENRIRLAIREAHRRNVPLVIASRPDDALAGIDAAIIELEPLGEEAALEYIERGASTHDEHRLDWVIETAEVTETPLYLQMAHELHAKGLLEYAHPRRREELLDTRAVDRASLRVGLLRTWVGALIDGHFEPQLPMKPGMRRLTVRQLGILACMGLKVDTLEVRFADLFEKRDGRHVFEQLLSDLQEKVAAVRASSDGTAEHDAVRMDQEVRLAASRGAQLRLVELRDDGVRFPHSILQAYLGSRVLEDVMRDEPDFLTQALRHPSRELLVALVMYSRSQRPGAPRRCYAEIQRALEASIANGDLSPTRRLDILTAALDIDSVDKCPRQRDIAKKLRDRWPHSSDERTVLEIKLKAIARFGEAARSMSASKLEPAYPELYDIAVKDLSYRIRLAAAHELGKGGDDAFTALEDAGRIAPPAPDAWQKDEQHREFQLRAWLAPLLVGSTSAGAHVGREEKARENLEAWIRAIAPGTSLPVSFEVALAQGFKHAANRRPQHPHARVGSRGYLAARAAEMLSRAEFWFTRLTLLQALTLWSLPETPGGAIEPPNGKPERLRRLRRRAADTGPPRRGADPEALVDYWRGRPLVDEHPFVAEARALAILALQHREPDRYLWIDESGVTTKIGGRPPHSEAVRKHNLWIPPSVGWSALHSRAQRLVADVLLLLNLIERGDDPEERDQRMRRATRDDLPPCLTAEREYLVPNLTVGTQEQVAPGVHCKDECRFDLCPYPPKGSQPHRVELSEAFCRRQQSLLRPWWLPGPRRTATWQGATPRELRRFWAKMEERARQ